MGIRYINAEPNLKFTRPTGFVYPTGLSVEIAAGPTSVDYLVVAGGGSGGGNYYSGGGGAGGYRTGSSFAITLGINYPITVGAGASGDAGSGKNGSNSVFSSISTIG